jgi:hypothetical protein
MAEIYFGPGFVSGWDSSIRSECRPKASRMRLQVTAICAVRFRRAVWAWLAAVRAIESTVMTGGTRTACDWPSPPTSMRLRYQAKPVCPGWLCAPQVVSPLSCSHCESSYPAGPRPRRRRCETATSPGWSRSLGDFECIRGRGKARSTEACSRRRADENFA